jgi:hypothetical protein
MIVAIAQENYRFPASDGLEIFICDLGHAIVQGCANILANLGFFDRLLQNFAIVS